MVAVAQYAESRGVTFIKAALTPFTTDAIEPRGIRNKGGVSVHEASYQNSQTIFGWAVAPIFSVPGARHPLFDQS
jgi:hypothetical protein